MSTTLNLARMFDPLGLTSASRKAGGGLKSGWDPAGIIVNKAAEKGTNNAAATQSAALTAATPITPASPIVLQTEQDMRRAALKKKGFASAYLAGDTGGWFGNLAPSPMGGPTGGGAKRLGG